MSKNHWLDAVRRVILAQTGDLRALAILAGEDPTTLYVGTALDGVDISGQDLRGMHLPNLDLNKVIWDEKTKIDPPYKNFSNPDTDLIGEPRAIVLCPGKGGDTQIERRTRGMRARLYSSFDSDKFLAEPEVPDIPKFIIGQGYESDNLKGAISVVPVAPGRTLDDRIHDTKRISGPLVFVLLPRRATTDDVLHGAVGDFVALAAHNPKLIRSMINEKSVFAFCSARGAGQYPRLDAISRIFSNIDLFGANVIGELTSLFEFAELTPTEADVAMHLFPKYRSVYGHRPTGWNEYSRASMLIAIGDRYNPRQGKFLDAAAQLFLRNGWSLSDSAKESSFQIDGGNYSYELILRRPKFTSQRLDQTLTNISIKKIHVVASPSEEDCCLALLRGQILVGLSDCANFTRDGGAIWSLLGNQAVRVSATRQNRIRSRYFGHLLKIAIDRTIAKFPPWVSNIVNTNTAFPLNVSHIGSFTTGPEFLVSSGAGRVVDQNMPIILKIGADGPELEELSRINSENRHPRQLEIKGV